MTVESICMTSSVLKEIVFCLVVVLVDFFSLRAIVFKQHMKCVNLNNKGCLSKVVLYFFGGIWLWH